MEGSWSLTTSSPCPRAPSWNATQTFVWPTASIRPVCPSSMGWSSVPTVEKMLLRPRR
jgi:hypothetical protein